MDQIWKFRPQYTARVGSPFFHLQSEAGSISLFCYLYHFSTPGIGIMGHKPYEVANFYVYDATS